MGVKFSLVYALSISIVLGCQSRDNSDESVAEKEMISIPVIIDTIEIDEYLENTYQESTNPTWISLAQYKIYFIGKTEDTIYLNPSFTSFDPPPPPPMQGIERKKEPYEHPYKKYLRGEDYNSEDTLYISSNLSIQIDTSKIITDSYPVLITNPDSFYAFVAYGNFIPMIMEALDSNGVWKPIQNYFTYICGNGVRSVILPPNESVVTLAPIFKGEYTTLLRLKLENSYSKPFKGQIHYRQFQSKYDQHGNYNEIYQKELKLKTNN